MHDYTLTTNDLKKLEGANAYIISGFDLEEKINNTIYKTYPNMNMIKSANAIESKDLIFDEEQEINAHVWMRIFLYQKQVESIYEGLYKLNPENEEKYLENVGIYIQKLKIREEQIKKMKEKLEGTKAVLISESLEYFLEDLGFELTEVHTHGEEAGISPEVLGKAVTKIKEENILYLFVDSIDNLNIAKTIERETGIQIIQLESNLAGPKEKDAYLDAMDSNLEKIQLLLHR